MTLGVGVFVVAPVLAAAVALIFGIAWLAAPASRGSLVERYPLPVLTWVIATVPTVLAGAAVVFGAAFAVDGGIAEAGSSRPSGVWNPVEQYAMPVLGLLGLVLGVLVIVMGHLRPRRGPWPRFAMLSVAAVPIAGVLYAAAMLLVQPDVVGGFMAMTLALGSIANALLARPAQDVRQARRDARRASASAVTTELPPPPPPPPPAPAPPL